MCDPYEFPQEKVWANGPQSSLEVYHPFQNHYAHQIIIFKLFRSLQLQFSGPTGINFRYSYSFVGLTEYFFTVTVRYSYIKKWSVELFSENYSYSYIKKWFSNLKCNDFEKNGKS